MRPGSLEKETIAPPRPHARVEANPCPEDHLGGLFNLLEGRSKLLRSAAATAVKQQARASRRTTPALSWHSLQGRCGSGNPAHPRFHFPKNSRRGLEEKLLLTRRGSKMIAASQPQPLRVSGQSFAPASVFSFRLQHTARLPPRFSPPPSASEGLPCGREVRAVDPR